VGLQHMVKRDRIQIGLLLSQRQISLALDCADEGATQPGTPVGNTSYRH
jgi:hypothetical protein